ncbi:LacI family transcriptional regulator [Bifidobacterium pseudolongum subsp. pseudolongum]|nr:LacI family DNA-binding transcriptional regulator [Bifidobacterium pseudolongum]RYQ47393.1 LacI family transcriptional regulator [Bifidobacterium pseudolongum subsp. pseudolongum]RYQ51410.1 LacI family transcriptional regulator [Bifidobacterium pseudolongum subsp. pseudolongum]
MAGIKDVAARAGVSISTVSYVVSGKRKIGAATQARVRAAALELGYRPVVDATEPASARGAHVLAVSSPLRPYTDVTNYAAFFFALATAAKRHGYGILLLTHEAGDQELRRVADRGMADGVFLLDVLLSDSRADMAGARSTANTCSARRCLWRRCSPTAAT